MNERFSWSQVFEALAAFAAAVAAAGMALGLPLQLGFSQLFQPEDGGLNLIQLSPVVIAIIAAFVVTSWLIPRSYTTGWFIAAIGLMAMTLVDHWSRVGQAEVMTLVFAAATGVVFGGVMLAASAASWAGRVAIATGFTAGAVLSQIALLLLNEIAGNEYMGSYSSNTIFLGILTLIVLVTAILASPAPADADAAAARPSPMFLMLVLIGSAVLMGGLVLRDNLAEQVGVEREALSEGNVGGTEALLEYSSIGLAVLIAAIFLWYVYRLGEMGAARWIVLMLALTPPLAMVSWSGFLEEYTVLSIVVALVTIAAGAFLALRVDAAAPWDAIGVVVAIVGLLLGTDYTSDRLGVTVLVSGSLLLAGTGLAIGHGMTRLLKPTTVTAQGMTAAFATAGWIVVLLAGHALAPNLVMGVGTGEMPPLSVPILCVLCAAGILVIFARRSTAAGDGDWSRDQTPARSLDTAS